METPPRVFFLTEAQTACSELVTAPLVTLEKQGKIRLKIAFEHEYRGSHLRRMVRNEADLLIVFRGSTRRGLRTLRAAKLAGIKTVWASDDDLIQLDSTNPVGGRYERSKVRETMDQLMRNADALWVFSRQMADRYLAKGFKHVHCCHSLAPLEYAQNGFQGKSSFSNCIRIGHIGDFSHANEMHHLTNGIKTLSEASLSREWEIHFVGYTPPELAEHPRVRTIPYIRGIDPFHEWLSKAAWSIGVAPLRDTPFNRCKTDNKFRTFSAFGIAGIYSDIPPYSDSVVHAHTGLLCQDNSDAYAKCLIKLIQDDSLRTSIQEKAKRTCAERYSRNAVVAQYESVLCSLLNVKALTQPSDECYSTCSLDLNRCRGA
jgi:glycosyltransferase involved in cell wall biosynthesis